jgi:hypothetical protein
MSNHRAVPDGRHGIADSGLQSHTDVGHRKGTQKMGSHRMPRKPSVMTRTVAAGGVAAGGAACCLGLLGDGTLPTANAFSASFVEPNGTTVQLNILQGNVILPQFNPGGNSSNISTVGNLFAGQGNGNTTSVGVNSTGSGSGTTNVAVSNGNVVQINILSGNVINPQLSLFGGNSSNISTLGNAAIGNGNGNFTGVGVTSTGTGSGTTVGVTNTEGNSNQKTNLSGNIINPQLSSGLGSGTPLSTPFSLGSGTPLSAPVSSGASVNSTPSKRHVSFGRS